MQRRRTFLRTGAVCGAAALAGCLAGGTGGPEGATLQSLDVAGSPGGPVAVLPSRVTLLDFWATWCAPCKPQMAELRAVRERFDDVHLLSITNESDRDAVREFWTTYEGTWPVALDTALRTNDRFGVTRMPTLLVFDAAGEEVWRHVGLARADRIGDRLREAGAEG